MNSPTSLQQPNRAASPSLPSPRATRKLTALTLLAAAVTHAAAVAAPLIHFSVVAAETGLTASSSSGIGISPDGHTVSSLAVGQSVVLQLFVDILGTDALLDNDGFTKTVGSFFSRDTTGSLTGFLRTDNSTVAGINNISPFTGTSSRSGAAQELSGIYAGGADGILDVGGTGPHPVLLVDYFTASSITLQSIDGQKFLIGETVFTATDGTGTTSIDFRPRIGGGVTSQRLTTVFQVDGIAYARNGDGSAASGGPTDALTFGAPVAITVPEPSALGLVLFGSMGLGAICRMDRRSR